jgi:pSer/pThr/pTyr-binding forkhead associated (FHA) protein
MDVVLKVTKGSKAGAKVSVKKEEFVIGRSPECHLCAGSTSISRRHCVIRRTDNHRVTIQDLGSRNGTLVNGHKITGETELASGDTIGIGMLEFMVTLTAGIKNDKMPQVSSVAEAVERTAQKSSNHDVKDDDISQWLLGVNEEQTRETQTIRLDDTKAGGLRQAMQQMMADEDLDFDPSSETAELEQVVEHDDSKCAEKKLNKPGKLPIIPPQPATKDSREAATEALRSWNRRR